METEIDEEFETRVGGLASDLSSMTHNDVVRSWDEIIHRWNVELILAEHRKIMTELGDKARINAHNNYITLTQQVMKI